MLRTFIPYVLLVSVSSGFFWTCAAPVQEAEEEPPALDFSNMDSSVRIQDNLFRFVNGGWIAHTQIPADKGSWGSFNELRQANDERLVALLTEEPDRDSPPLHADQIKAIDFYQVGMDSALAEKVGASVLQATFKTIDEIADVQRLQAYLGEGVFTGSDHFFDFNVGPDAKDSKRMTVYLSWGGFGLPERDYYIKTDEKSKATRDRYQRHIVQMLALIADKDTASASLSARRIMAIETQLAKATLTKEERRDMNRQYNKMAVSQLDELVPSLDWPAYFKLLGVYEDSVVVRQPVFMKACQDIIASARWDAIRDYLTWRAVDVAAPFLNHEAVKLDFSFYEKYMDGIDRMQPRWRRVLRVTDRFLGEAVGQLYVARFFPEEAKKKADEMVENLKLAMAERIKNLTWMSDSTKIRALDKLTLLTTKIGYPDKWRSYEDLNVGSESYYQNVRHAARFLQQRQINKLGRPVDRQEWGMSPQTVNAYYNPLFNEIVFPAGILQPPFYNYKADDAVNYGGIGGVIGHEISHAFDDFGSQFDGEGNLNNWWTEEDAEKFKKRGQKLIAQYDAYEPLPDVFVQGAFTLGENIGDLGGLNIAYDALQRFLRENGRPEKIDGYTPEQRFFLSWATIWRFKVRDERLHTLVNTDPHSPPRYRVNGVVSNVPPFYEAFNVKEGDSLYFSEDKRVVIW